MLFRSVQNVIHNLTYLTENFRPLNISIYFLTTYCGLVVVVAVTAAAAAANFASINVFNTTYNNAMSGNL
jgi:hypothetical protein